MTLVRQAAATDAAAVADVYLRARHAAVPAIPPMAHPDDDVRRWFANVVLVDDRREVWVAEADNGLVVGLLVLEDEDWIDQLYLDPEWTGRRIGSQLVEVAKRRRPDGLQLWTFASNRGAQRFYERHGFVVVERTDGSGNEERSPDVRYAWRASPGGVKGDVGTELELVRLAAGPWAVEVLPAVGARLHRITHDGRALLRTPPAPRAHIDEPFFWGAYPMVPWCNRVPRGELFFNGRRYQVPVNHVDGSAIHGEAYDRPWNVVAPGRFRYESEGRGFPWPYTAELAVTVEPAGVVVELSVANAGSEPMPAGAGMHPWFVAPVELALPAELVYDGRVYRDPPEPALAADHERDLRSLQPLPWGLDDGFTGLTGHEARLTVDGAALDLTWSDNATVVMVCSYEPVHAVAIEPQTHAPDGFTRAERGQPHGVHVLQPGQRLTTWLRLGADTA